MYDDDFQRMLRDHAGGGAEVAIVVRHPDGTETQALVAQDASVILESAPEIPLTYRPGRAVHQIRVTTLGQVTLYSPEFFANGRQRQPLPLHLTAERAES